MKRLCSCPTPWHHWNHPTDVAEPSRGMIRRLASMGDSVVIPTARAPWTFLARPMLQRRNRLYLRPVLLGIFRVVVVTARRSDVRCPDVVFGKAWRAVEVSRGLETMLHLRQHIQSMPPQPRSDVLTFKSFFSQRPFCGLNRRNTYEGLRDPADSDQRRGRRRRGRE